jgi:hypothetical protein
MKSKSCRAGALAREHSALADLSFSGVSQAQYDEILKTMEVVRAVASYLPAASAKGRAFHRWLIELDVDCLGYGVADPQARQDIADAVLRMNGSADVMRLLAAA